MNSIIQARQAALQLIAKSDGQPINIPANATVTAQIYSEDGSEPFFNSVDLASDTQGADWQNGVVGMVIDDGSTASLPSPAVMILVVINGLPKRFKVPVISLDAEAEHSDLFIKDFIVEEMRSEHLMLMAQTFFNNITLTDKFIWDKIVAAESDIKHTLRVPLVPTAFFPSAPTDSEVAALGSMPYAIDPAYDYAPNFFTGDKWGFIVTRYKPIVSVTQVKFFYPTPTQGVFQFPSEWIRIDGKYGQIRFVPSSNAFAAPLNAYILQLMSGASVIPHAIELRYIAGIDTRKDYPELIDVIKRAAVLRIISDGFIPQSGSISADGLSQSMSIDMQKYRDVNETILNGPKGSNGGIMSAIHGIRLSVMG